MSPILGFVAAAGLLLAMKRLIREPRLYRPPDEGASPPRWVRGVLLATCGGVSFAHGSNDGQKGMGLILLDPDRLSADALRAQHQRPEAGEERPRGRSRNPRHPSGAGTRVPDSRDSVRSRRHRRGPQGEDSPRRGPACRPLGDPPGDLSPADGISAGPAPPGPSARRSRRTPSTSTGRSSTCRPGSSSAWRWRWGWARWSVTSGSW